MSETPPFHLSVPVPMLADFKSKPAWLTQLNNTITLHSIPENKQIALFKAGLDEKHTNWLSSLNTEQTKDYKTIIDTFTSSFINSHAKILERPQLYQRKQDGTPVHVYLINLMLDVKRFSLGDDEAMAVLINGLAGPAHQVQSCGENPTNTCKGHRACSAG